MEETVSIPLADLDSLYGILLAYGSVAEGPVGMSEVDFVMSLVGITPARRLELSQTYKPIVDAYMQRKLDAKGQQA